MFQKALVVKESPYTNFEEFLPVKHIHQAKKDMIFHNICYGGNISKCQENMKISF